MATQKTADLDTALAEGASNNLLILKPRMTPLGLILRGDSPLVLNPYGPKLLEEMIRDQAKSASGKGKKSAKDPVECFNGSRYRLPDGRDAVKASAIRAATISAARFCDKSVPMTLVAGVFFVNRRQQLIPIEHPEKGWYGVDVEPLHDRRFVRVNTKGAGTGSLDVRHRPMYDPWQITVEVEYDATNISAEQVVNLVERAGVSIGIGNGRPELKRSMQWGTFHVIDVGTVAEAAE